MKNNFLLLLGIWEILNSGKYNNKNIYETSFFKIVDSLKIPVEYSLLCPINSYVIFSKQLTKKKNLNIKKWSQIFNILDLNNINGIIIYYLSYYNLNKLIEMLPNLSFQLQKKMINNMYIPVKKKKLITEVSDNFLINYIKELNKEGSKNKNSIKLYNIKGNNLKLIKKIFRIKRNINYKKGLKLLMELRNPKEYKYINQKYKIRERLIILLIKTAKNKKELDNIMLNEKSKACLDSFELNVYKKYKR